MGACYCVLIYKVLYFCDPVNPKSIYNQYQTHANPSLLLLFYLYQGRTEDNTHLKSQSYLLSSTHGCQVSCPEQSFHDTALQIALLVYMFVPLGAHGCMRVRCGGQRSESLRAAHLGFWDGLSLAWSSSTQLGWLTNKPQLPAITNGCHHSWIFTWVPGFKFRSSYLW